MSLILGILMLFGQQVTTSETREALEPERPFTLEEPLREALEEVFRFDRRLLELKILDRHGVPAHPSDLTTKPRATSFLREGERGLFVGKEGFAFESWTPHFEQLIESGRHDRGAVAAQRLIAGNEELEPEELLEWVTDEFLEADPVEGSLEATELHRFALRQYRLAPLSNGSIAYVIWGVLFHDEYWRERGRDREAFISALIDRGVTSQMCGMAVRRVLQAPLLYDPGQKGQGVAFYLTDLRDRVGFTHRHREQLEEIIRLLEDADAQTVDGPNPFDAESPREAGAPIEEPGSPSRLGHVREWAHELLGWVLFELDPETADESMRHAPTLDARKAYWNALANTIPFHEFRAQVLSEVRAMLEGDDGHPDQARIAELEALGEEGLLSVEQERELRSLRDRCREDRRELVSHVARLLAVSGILTDYGEAVRAVGVDLHGLLANGGLAGPADVAYHDTHMLLRPACTDLMSVRSPVVHGVMDDVLRGSLELPEYVQTYLLFSVRAASVPGYESVLNRVLADGTPFQRGRALGDGRWLDDHSYRRELLRLFEDGGNDDLDAVDREAAWEGALHCLNNRRSGDARKFLLESIRAGHWADADRITPWIEVRYGTRQWLREQVTEEEWAAFEAQGLLHPEYRASQ